VGRRGHGRAEQPVALDAVAARLDLLGQRFFQQLMVYGGNVVADQWTGEQLRRHDA
jgi:hypothetical protein